jgi:hypothetical protein
MGSRPGYRVPTVEDLETKARERLDELKSLWLMGSDW